MLIIWSVVLYLRKYLNSQKYTDLLRIVGMSPSPLSPYAIMVNKEFDGKNYVYEMVRNLCPSCHQDTVSKKLCVVEDLPEMSKKSDFKHKIIRQLDKDLCLGYGIGKKHEEEQERDYNSIVQISVVRKENHLTLTIQYASKPPILIELVSNMGEWLRTSCLSALKGTGEEGGREQVYDLDIIKNLSGKHVIYYRVKRNLAVATTDYLDAMRTDSSQDEGSVRVEKFLGAMDDDYNGENLLYVLNFRGFLLFLLNLSRSGLKKSLIRKQIIQVLSNPRTIEIAPFLKYWDDFEKAGFDVISSLREIAVELESHHEENTTALSSGNRTYLLRRATEIYFIKMTNYFFLRTDKSSPFSHYYSQKKGFAELQEIRRKTDGYRLSILGLLKMWYTDDLKAVDDLIEMYQIKEQ